MRKKKPNAKMLVSGCLANGVNFEYSGEAQNILNQTVIVPPSQIIKYVLNYLNIKVPKYDELGIKVPYSFKDGVIRLSPGHGCPNHCRFCKSSYANYQPRSIPLDDIKAFASEIEKIPYDVDIDIAAPNFTTYGIDLYKEQRAHDVIKILSQPKNVKTISCGALINFYPELLDEIIRNNKIIEIFSSLETGSESLYNTMGRPISLEKYISIVKKIRKERPDILIGSEVIAGYPGENANDVSVTIDLIRSLGIYVSHVWPYFDAPPLYDLPYHSKLYRELSQKRYVRRLKTHNRHVLIKHKKYLEQKY